MVLYFLLNFKFKSLHLSCKCQPSCQPVKILFGILILTFLALATVPRFVSADLINVLNIFIGLGGAGSNERVESVEQMLTCTR